MRVRRCPACHREVAAKLESLALGHASLRTTGIYRDVSGREEHLFAERIWESW